MARLARRRGRSSSFRPRRSRRSRTYKEPRQQEIREVVRWYDRKRHRWAKAPDDPKHPPKHYSRKVFQERRTVKGRFVDLIEVSSADPYYREGIVPRTGRHQGMVFDALAKTNILASINRMKPTMAEIRVVGQGVKDGKQHRLSWQIQFHERERLGQFLKREIVRRLREKGFRTQYALNIVDWRKVQETIRRLKKAGANYPYLVSRDVASKLEQLRKVRVIVKLFK